MIGEHAERSFDLMREKRITRFCFLLRGFGWHSLRASTYFCVLPGTERDAIFLTRRFLETFVLILSQSKLSTAINSYGLLRRQRVGESE